MTWNASDGSQPIIGGHEAETLVNDRFPFYIIYGIERFNIQNIIISKQSDSRYMNKLYSKDIQYGNEGNWVDEMYCHVRKLSLQVYKQETRV